MTHSSFPGAPKDARWATSDASDAAARGADAHSAVDAAQWRVAPPLNVARQAVRAVELHGTVYALGGGGDDAPVEALYDAGSEVADAAARWVALPVSFGHCPFYGSCVASAERGVVYFASKRHFDMFDPRVPRIAALPRAPENVDASPGAIFGDRLYSLSPMQAFDLQAGRWVADLAPVANDTGGMQAAAAVPLADERVLVVAGSYTSTCRVFSLRDWAYTSVEPSMARMRMGVAACAL